MLKQLHLVILQRKKMEKVKFGLFAYLFHKKTNIKILDEQIQSNVANLE